MNAAWLLVAVVYATAVAAARHARVDLPWRVAALLYALVLVFLFRPLTGPYANFPTDVAQLIHPWAAGAPPGLSKFNVSRYEMQDVIFQMVPWAEQVRESWLRLEPPLWNERVGLGHPLLANGQSAALSPLRLLVLPLPLAYAMAGEAALKILVAATFMFLFCRRRFDELPSVVGAISFGFCTFLIAWLHMPHASAAAWLPAVFYAIDLIAEGATFGRLVFAAALGPMTLFAGHPETAAHMVFVAALYALWRTSGWRFIAALLAACVLAVCFSAPLLLPFLEALPHSVRYHDVQARPHTDGTPYSDFQSLLPLFQPGYGARAETISGFAGFLGIAAWFGLLARVVARRTWRSFETFLVLATVLIWAIIDDWPITAPFRHLFAASNNARMRLFICFLTASMAAALVHYMKRDRLVFLASLAGGVATLVFLAVRADLAHWVPLAVLAVAATRVRLAIAAAVFAELWVAIHHWNVIRPVNELFPPTPLIETLVRARGAQPFRIAGLNGALFPNTQAFFGLQDARIHDPMATMRYARFLGAAMPYDPLEYYPRFKTADSPIYDELNVKWLVTDPGVEVSGRWKRIYDGTDGRIYENPTVKPRFMADGARIEIVHADGDEYELVVDAPHETLVSASIAYWPGWRVTHNGRSLDVGMVGGVFLGFVLPPGKGTVRVRYVPLSFRAGVAVALVALVALAALPIIRRRV